MKLTRIYCGSNNETGELELDKIINVMRTAQQEYTLIKARGVWKDSEESTCIIEILGNYNTGIIPQLRRELAQQSILVITSIVDAEFYD